MSIELRQVGIVLVFVVEFIILAEIIIYSSVGQVRLFLLLGRLLFRLRRRLSFPAIEQRQSKLLGATFNFPA